MVGTHEEFIEAVSKAMDRASKKVMDDLNHTWELNYWHNQLLTLLESRLNDSLKIRQTPNESFSETVKY